MNTIRFFCAIALVAFSMVAHAELPLTVEDLITDKGKIKLDVSIAYANSDRKGVSTGEPILIQTGPTSFVTVPTLVGESLTNSDLVVGTLGLRYGLTAKAEIFTRASYLYNSSRSSSVSGTASNSDNRFADAWAGVNYQFKEDDDTPALLGFAEVALHEKYESSSSFKSYLAGLTTYKAIDPVVFVLTTAYRFNQSRKNGDRDYEPGDMLFLSPSIAFAVNDRVTLTTGVQWTNRQVDKVDDQTLGIRRTNTDLLLGVGYGISKKSTLNFTVKANASGSDGADLRLNWLHTF
uniref:MetA-pathway of phenol degradation n=1 Tax=Candidatus Kentrum sp. LPFa TaxID=2126335 RepID=A0A450W2Z8_9GAMM|nr:MAG: Putative MetA-pathway of phenol degradation [Candidatus Kentron sp. LPFa]VFK24552.1 MAG: Putative MetA-pathway of phenol degradation [Candidatus Kentron sp. LPFa]